MTNKFLNSTLPISCILSSIFAFAPTSLAAYIPPKDQEPASDKSINAGRRGCPTVKIPLTVLASKKYVGWTASTRPSFALFVSGSFEVDFRLYEFGDNGQLKKEIVQTKKKNTPGKIMTISPLKNQPGLEVGKKYLWQVAIKCPQTYFVQSAEFRVKAISSELKTKIEATQDKAKKVEIYAMNGLWYDSFSMAQQINYNNQALESVSGLLKDLLKWEKTTANDIISEKKKEDVQNHAQRLRQVIANYQSK
jgi:hypothetical protein